MGSSSKDRAFSRALHQHIADEEEEIVLSCEPPPANEPDCITAILNSWRNKDYFGLLGLPQPSVDELGEPVWQCSENDVSRAYRQLSLSVHPDKNPSEEAKMAFDYLSKANKILSDPEQLGTVLRESTAAALQRKEQAEATATVGERVALNAHKSQEQRKLRKRQRENFEGEILRQVRSKQERSGRRKRSTYRRGNLHKSDDNPEENADDEDNKSEPEEWKGPRSKDKSKTGRRKPKLIF